MTCDDLAYTGVGVQIGPLLILAIVCLFIGALLLLMSRRRGRVVTAVLVLLISGAAMAITAGTPIPAAADECPPIGSSPVSEPIPGLPIDSLPAQRDPRNNSLTIIQTSVMEGLAPGVVPVAITGIVTNNGADGTIIYEIEVEITAVGTIFGSGPGVCDSSDYFLATEKYPPNLDPTRARMPVIKYLAPGGSTTFGGANIGFSNKSTNQDSCKGATIALLYTANP